VSRRPRQPDRELPEYLRRLGLPPRKALGQHFLVDEFVLAEIAEACRLDEDSTVIEIGAGPGGLTAELVRRAGHVIAVEIDEELAALTRERLVKETGLTVLAADVLDFEPEELLEEAAATPPYVAVGNLPYYITQPILRHLLEARTPPERITVLMQREVARRITAGPGRESLLSNSIKVYGRPEYLLDVSSDAFWPEPKVQSALVGIDRLDEPAVALDEKQLNVFFHLLRAGFAQPRKQLHNALPSALDLPNLDVRGAIEAADLDPTLRAQHLSLADWERLYHELLERHPEALVLG
jgi:16S rRNA (adenine1518-N6/adenine1519-N6)-dimethyltransferase